MGPRRLEPLPDDTYEEAAWREETRGSGPWWHVERRCPRCGKPMAMSYGTAAPPGTGTVLLGDDRTVAMAVVYPDGTRSSTVMSHPCRNQWAELAGLVMEAEAATQ